LDRAHKSGNAGNILIPERFYLVSIPVASLENNCKAVEILIFAVKMKNYTIWNN